MKRQPITHLGPAFAVLTMAFFSVLTPAIITKESTSLDRLEKFHQPFIDKGGSASLSQLAAALPNHGEWQKFLTENGEHDIWLDPQTGRIRSVSGRIPWIPGMFNSLTEKDIAGFMTAPGAEVGIPELDRIARNFITTHAGLFRIPAGITYALNASGSMQGSPNSNMWNLRYDLFLKGVPIKGGALTFLIKHGNLILWGTEGLDDVSQPLAAPAIRGEYAVMSAAAYMGGFDDSRDTLMGEPTLRVLPEHTETAHGYRQVWEVTVARADEGTYRTTLDAATGEIIDFRDMNESAQVRGGIYPTSNSVPEVSRPLGFANFNAGVFADSGGSFVYPGGTVTSTLVGRYVRMNDACGAISKAVSAAPGDIDFGASAGTDCTIPAAGGGAGNTHASRSCYYHLDQIKQKGRYFYPANGWLGGVLQANVNINNTCNANWNGTQVNFFRSGGGCGNTGEIAGVFLHEWGHGMDSNDGNGAGGSGEAMGDTVAMLQLRNSCIGDAFFTTLNRGCGQQGNGNFNCSGYGNCCTNCSGVRDQDRASHATNKIMTPATINADCTSAGGDPCGREVHCEGMLPGNTVWDLAARDFPAIPLAANDAWALIDKLWWVSGPTRNAAYTCANKTAAPWNNGCGASSWYKTFLAADDDDGNLANGTPHAATVFLGFNRHGISCGIASDAANTNQTGCPAIGSVGTLAGSPGNNTANLTWNVATNAASYTVSRNNLGCAFGFTPIATVTPGTTISYADTTASNGTTWYYNIQAHGTNTNCVGVISNCVSVTPVASACSAPTGLANNTAVDAGTACTATGVTVNWTAPSAWGDTAGTRTWNVLRNGVAIAAGPCSGAIPVATLTCTDTTAVAGTAYTYSVRANNGCAMSTTTAGVSATDLTGTVPTGLANNSAADINACTATGNSVTWTAPTGWNDNASGTRTWTVLRGGVAVAAGPCFGALTAATVTCNDTSAAAGTAYTYTVRANNGCALQTTTTPGASATDAVGVAPSGVNAPTVADASACTSPGINVTWVAPTWNGAAGTYIILRDGVAVVGGACAGNIPAATLTCLDTTAAAGAHTYQLRATNGCALITTSAASASINDLAGAVPSGLANNTAADINACTATGNSVTWTAPTGWNDNASGTRTWTVLRGGVAVAAGPCAGALTAATVTCNDTSAVAGTAYTYTVRANNGCGLQTTTTPGASATDVVGVAPSGVNAPAVADPSACTTTGINVTWVAPTWNGAAGTYVILRDGVAVVGGACAGNIPAATLTCLDTTAAAGAHTYQVRATNGCALATTSAASASVTDLAGAVPSGFANNGAADINICTATGNSVTWTAPTGWNDNASGTRTYTVMRGGVAVAAGPCSGALTAATVTCNDTSAVAGTAYTYTVRANNGCALQTLTTPGASATDAVDVTAPGSPAQTVTKASPNINFSWPTVPTTANYLSYSAATANPATWNLRNTTATLAWSNAADLASATSFFYTTTSRDTCLNESPK